MINKLVTEHLFPQNITFKSMKPNQFRGVDYAVVRKFKAPIERFNTNADLHIWANDLFQKMRGKDISSSKVAITLARKKIINLWMKVLEQDDKLDCVQKLFIFSSLISKLKHNNENLPLMPNKKIIQKTLDESINILKLEKERQINFNKIYRNNLFDYFKSEAFPKQKEQTGWVVIPSKKQAPDNYEENVDRLNFFSNKNWCTKKLHADYYLSSGEFHIYFDKGEPKLGIRFSGCEILEVQGEKNNTLIPREYINKLEEHIRTGNYYINDDIEYIINLSK